MNFVENKGQFSEQVLFRADLPLGQAIATNEGMIVTVYDPVEIDKRAAEGIRLEAEVQRGEPHRDLVWRKKGHTWQLNFLGASPNMKVESRSSHEDVWNFFSGDAQATDVRAYQEIWYRDVYKATDVRYYPAADGSLEYDIICKPGSDPSMIAVEFKGLDRLQVNEKGELLLSTSLGEVAYPEPYVYQQVAGKEQRIGARYLAEGNVLRFELDEYDVSEPLIIDPIAMRWATWLNTNSTGDNHGHCIWVDPTDGAIYVVSRVVGTTDQITPGAFDVTANGNLEIIVGKYFEPTDVGDSGVRVWQTYIGGNGDDNPYAMEQGPDGHFYITGNTTSTNYPLIGGPAFSGPSVDQQSQSGADIFITKINAAGNSIKSAVVGGNGSDLSYDLRIDGAGDLLVCGYTSSSNLATSNPGTGATNGNSGNDVIIFKMNSGLDAVQWLKNYGGSGTDQAMIMLLTPTNDILVGGLTTSNNFPLLLPRQSSRGGSQAGLLQRLNANGDLQWSSYFTSANSSTASILCMSLHTNGTEFYFGGVTSGLHSSNISASGVYDNTHNGSNDFFVARMEIDQDFIGGTYVGGSSNEVNMMGLNTDLNNDVFVFGYTNSTNFPVSGGDNVPLQASKQGTSSSNDKVFFKLESDLSALEFSTYYGGSVDDYDPVGERGIKFSNCRIYTIVTARSNNIPLTQGALNTTKLSSTSRYEPGLVVWANPPDLLDNSIIGNQAVCEGEVPGDVIGSVPSYSLPTIVRNNSPSSYPAFPDAATYQWQISTDSLNWTDIAGADAQNLPGSMIGPVDQKTYVRRIIGGDACILAGAADQVVTVKIVSVSADIEHVSCNGANDGSITVSSDGQAPFQYQWDHGPNTATISGLAPGSYTVTVTDVNLCSAEGTFVVTEPAVLMGDVDVNDATCNESNGSASVEAQGGTTPYSYLWSTGATGSDLNGVPGGSYSVTITDAHQCVLELPFTIGSTGTPDVSAGPSMVIDCTTGPEVQLAGGSSTPGVSFSWVASNGGNIVSGPNTATPTVNAAGTYTLTVTADQCTAIASTTVTSDLAAPDALASVSGVLTCTETMVTIQGTSSTDGVSYSWSGPDGFSSNDQNAEVSVAGTYTLTVTAANGCTQTADVVVALDIELPDVSAAGGIITCTTPCVTLDGGSTDGVGFAWSGPDQFQSTDEDPEVCAPGIYVLVVTGANGCTSTTEVVVDLDIELPDVSAVGGTITCASQCVTLDGGSTNGVGFAWTGPAGFQSAEEDPEACTPGIYTLTVTAANGCTSTAEAVVGLDLEAPTANAMGGTITCTTTCIMLDGGSTTDGVSFMWSGPDGYTSSSEDPEVCAPGTYTLTVTAANGCTRTANALVELDADVPDATAEGGTITCDNECVTLVGGSITAGVSFHWSGNGLDSDEQNVEVCAAGVYTLTVTAANGCISTATAVVDLDDDLPSIQTEGGSINCYQPCTWLSGSSDTPGATYAWIFNGQVSQGEIFYACVAGEYTFQVTGPNGCISTETVSVTGNFTTPDVTAEGGVITCANECVLLQGASTSNILNYNWTGDGFDEDGESVEVCIPGTYVLTVTASNGCVNTATVEVGLDTDVPDATAEGGTITCDNACVTLQGSSTTAGVSFHWTGNGLSIDGPVAEVCSAGTYTLTVTAANGCTNTVTVEVELDNVIPEVSAQGSTIPCGEECIQLIGTTDQEDALFAWSGPGDFTSNDVAPLVCAPGTYTLMVTTSGGCSNSTTVVVTQALVPEIVVEGDCDSPGAGWASVEVLSDGVHQYFWSTEETTASITGLSTGTYTVTVVDENQCSTTGEVSLECPDACDIGIMVEWGCLGDENGWAALESVTGATNPVSILWSTGDVVQFIYGLPSGDHWVMVTDANGCWEKVEFTIDCEKPCDMELMVEWGCIGESNGWAALEGVTGATDPVSILWSTGETSQYVDGLPSGDHWVMVTDANGCWEKVEFTVDCEKDCEVEVMVEWGCLAESNGWAALESVTGATNPVSILWSTGETVQFIHGLPSGDHWVMVTDANGCWNKVEFTVDCEKDCEVEVMVEWGCLAESNGWAALESVTGATNPVSILWSTGETVQFIHGLPSGDHWVMVTDANGCWNKVEFTVDCEKDCELALEIASGCADGAGWAEITDVTGATAPVSILWSTGATSAFISGLPAGDHWVMVTDAEECWVKEEFTIDCVPEVCQLRTQTQGGYGAPPNGNNPGVYVHANFAAAFPGGLEIGCVNKLRLTSAQAVTNYLPAGGPPAMLPAGTMVNPSSYGNVLAAQLVAAKLSVGFDAYDPDFGAAGTLLGNTYITSGMFAGWTVSGVIEAADAYIGGCASTYTASQFNAVLTAINENFVDGTNNNGFLACAPLNASISTPAFSMGAADVLEVFPNPATEKFTTKITLGEAGQVSVDMWDLTGRRVMDLGVFNAEAGEVRTFSSDATTLLPGTYIVHVQRGDERTTQRIVIAR